MTYSDHSYVVVKTVVRIINKIKITKKEQNVLVNMFIVDWSVG